MRRNRLRFLFSQLSAIPVFLSAVLAGVFVLWELRACAPARPPEWAVLVAIVAVGAGLALLSALAMALWGKMLVCLGVLSAEEARGYPYSKPWERDGAA
jgi:hypothetical protein